MKKIRWCLVHKRIATHKNDDGTYKCDPKLGGILLPCQVILRPQFVYKSVVVTFLIECENVTTFNEGWHRNIITQALAYWGARDINVKFSKPKKADETTDSNLPCKS